jgi:hypothetical protein
VNRSIEFTTEILFRHWKGLSLFTGLVGTAAVIFAKDISSWSAFQTGLLILSVFVLSFLVKVISQSHRYYLNFMRPIKVLKGVPGGAVHNNARIVVLEPAEFVEVGTILMMFSNSSGAEEFVCLLRVFSKDSRKQMQAFQWIPQESVHDIAGYFSTDANMSRLYATPLITNETFETCERISTQGGGRGP